MEQAMAGHCVITAASQKGGLPNLFADFLIQGTGCWVCWYDSRLGCERPRVKFPEQPFDIIPVVGARAKSAK